MSKALNSPTGRLLRNSRLFSLPPPLPVPNVEGVSSAGILRASDTATLPYPVRQAIASPASSRSRGDWGLKRPLPLRSTGGSTPHLRIKAIDNMEHITDFDSAADHTQSLAKFQELSVPMVMRASRDTISAKKRVPVSVFDDALDHTALEESGLQQALQRLRRVKNVPGDARIESHTGQRMSADQYRRELTHEAARLRGSSASTSDARWKTEGPWVAGMTEDEFQHYLKTELHTRSSKQTFLAFVKQARVEQKRRNATARIREERGLTAESAAEDQAEIDEAGHMDDAEMKEYLKTLRDDHTNLQSELATLIQQYFDLPPFAMEDVAERDGDDKRPSVLRELLSDNTDDGPPATHQSAGISYLRTAAVMDNHPQLGAQTHRAPVQARVVRPRGMQQSSNELAKLGVGGFVTQDATRGSFQHAAGSHGALTGTLDAELAGGNKVWLHADKAFVDEKGRIRLDVVEGQELAVEVKTGVPSARKGIESSPSRVMKGFGLRQMEERLDAGTQRGAGGRAANYGTALPDMRRGGGGGGGGAARATGFDEEIQARREQGGDARSSVETISAMLAKNQEEQQRRRRPRPRQ